LRKKGRPQARATEASNDGDAALLAAAGQGNLEFVRWMLAKGGAKVTEANNDGATALLMAAYQGHLEIVQWLLAEGGAKVTEASNEGETALLVAAYRGHLEIVQWLLADGGAKVTEADNDGDTALLAAADRGHLEIVQWLLADGGAKLPEGLPIWDLSSSNRFLLKILLLHGALPAASPLHSSHQQLVAQGVVLRTGLPVWRAQRESLLRESAFGEAVAESAILALVDHLAEPSVEEAWALVEQGDISDESGHAPRPRKRQRRA
jgi:hypothetical protein